MTNTLIRTRAHNLKTEEALATKTKGKVTQKMCSLTIKFYKLNELKNKYSREAEAARVDLFNEMEGKNVTLVTTSYLDEEGNETGLRASVSDSERTVIDIDKLRSLVSDEIFNACVSSTKKAVEEKAGKLVAEQASLRVAGSRNVSVKKTK